MISQSLAVVTPRMTAAAQSKHEVMAVHGKSPYPSGDGVGWGRGLSVRDPLEDEACELSFVSRSSLGKDGVEVGKPTGIEG